jgi:hypothetical protein
VDRPVQCNVFKLFTTMIFLLFASVAVMWSYSRDPAIRLVMDKLLKVASPLCVDVQVKQESCKLQSIQTVYGQVHHASIISLVAHETCRLHLYKLKYSVSGTFESINEALNDKQF